MMPYAIVIIPLGADDGGGYVAYVPDLPGCMSDGDTAEEAAANATDAIAEWSDAQTRRGQPMPEPGTALRAAEDREGNLLEALRMMVEYAQGADETIKALDRKLAELVALARQDAGRPGIKLSNMVFTQLTRAPRNH